MNKEIKTCRQCKNQFEITPDDLGFYEKMGVPAPKLCPDCRMKRKLIWRNERTFYKRRCDLCGESIITIYHPHHSAPIYCVKCYHSDKWNPLSYGLIYNSERPFFEQFQKLLISVPKAATHIGTAGAENVNSEYVNFAGGNKNCYLIFNSTSNEDCVYSRGIMQSKNTLDAYFAHQLEQCYENVNVHRSNKVFYSDHAKDSFNSFFTLNCADVQNCFGCVNLRHKSYYFFNKPLAKEEWIGKVKDILGSYRKIEETKKRFKEFLLQFPHRENNNLKTANCTGNYIFESKNCVNSFEVFDSENLKYASFVKLLKDSYDVVGRGIQSELLLETVATGSGSSRIISAWSVEASYNVEYSYDLRSCAHCIGCVGLKHAEYCILNKKYSEAEYQKLRNVIVAELKQKELYGLYFPPELSPWAYNETLAQENYPLSKKDALAQGFRWEDDIPRTRSQETLKPEQIPDHIKDVPDSILNEILRCVNCGYNYRLIRSELEFYRQMLIPIPRKCFQCRYLDRLVRRGPFKLYSRQCAKCGKDIQTTYAPERPEIVYCEECYNAEVV